MYKHIIWDFDGTLYDSYPPMINAFIETLSNEGIIETKENISKLMRISMKHLLNYCNNKYTLPSDFISKFKIIREKHEDQILKPFDGGIELCREITKNGKKNYIFTHRGNSTINYLKKFDIYDEFTEIITADDNFERKPSPEGILYFINKYKINREEAIIIGDRELDLLSGKNAGISSCYFNVLDTNNLESADYMIHSLKDLYFLIIEKT